MSLIGRFKRGMQKLRQGQIQKIRIYGEELIPKVSMGDGDPGS